MLDDHSRGWTVTASSEAENIASKSRPLSRLNRPTRDLIVRAHRERGLLLRDLIASAVRKISGAVTGRPAS
jgi:hypothetical protein